MEKEIKEMVEAHIKRAETEGVKLKTYKSRRSSLHAIIKTPEQAKRFMKMLELAERGEL